MPFIQVKLIENVFSPEQKQQLITRITDAFIEVEGEHIRPVTFVVIDENPEVREDMEEMGLLHVDGRASDDDILCEAGIMRARAVITCVDSDAENIFVTITARALRPDIEIVARAAEERTEQKLVRAGANDVVSPYKASGDTMAKLALNVADARERSRPIDLDADGRAEGRVAEVDAAG